MAAPANIDEILQLLEAAAFSKNQSRQQSEVVTKQLEEWQARPNFHATLQSIAQSKAYPSATRTLALTQLKNGIDKHWRAGSTITRDEQASIRTRLQHIDLEEPDGRIVSLSAVIFASIARRDFPSKWPSLFDDLIRLYQFANASHQHRFAFALKIIQKTITEFQTLRLANPRKAYLEAAPRLLQALAADRDLRSVFSSEGASNSLPTASVTPSVLVFKCIRRLTVGAFECPHYDDAIVAIWNGSQHCLKVGMTDQPFNDQWRMALMKQIIKFHVSFAQAHPISFATFKPAPLVRFYWDAATSLRDRQLGETDGLDESLEDGLAPFFLLRALMLQRACLKAAHNAVHTTKFLKSRDPEEPSRAREHLKRHVLTQDFIARLFNDLISKYMTYSPSDVEDWTDEAEEWEIKEYDAEDAFEQSIRPCAERLFLDITLWYKDLITPPLLQLVNSYVGSDNVLIKDAVYSALGLAASRVHEHFDFNHLLENRITKDMDDTSANYNIIRRRIGVLLAQWIPITDAISTTNKSKVYGMYRDLLNKSDVRNDQVVRITAGKRFKDVGDEFAFEPESFRPYASDILQCIVDLIIEVQLPENKLALLDTLRCIVERMDATVLQFADLIVGLMQRLWGEVEKEQLMKKAIVSVLAKLTGSLKSASAPLQSFVIPLLRQVLDPESPENLYLWEDSLDLLHELIQQSSAPANAELNHVALQYMRHLDHTDGQSLEKLLQIVESVSILSSSQILESADARTFLIGRISPLMVAKSIQIVGSVAFSLELLVRAAADRSGQVDLQTLLSDLTNAGFTKAAMDCVLGCWSAHQTHGPARKDPPSSAGSETYFFVILSRILLCSPEAFVHLVAVAAHERGAEAQGILKRILEEWFSHLDNVGNIARKKLMIMALTRLFDLQEPWLLSKLQDYLAIWTTSLIELQDGDQDKGGDTLVMPPYEAPSGLDAQIRTPEEDRRMRLSHEDPVHTINLSSFVKARVDAVVEHTGGSQAFQEQYLANVDRDVVQQFTALF